jgi:putative glycosyltransferase (TIGR04372 family)
MSMGHTVARFRRSVGWRKARLLSTGCFWIWRAVQVSLSPIVLLRLDTTHASRIGHLVPESDQVIDQKSDGFEGSRGQDIIIFPESACNQFLANFYKGRFQDLPNTKVLASGENPFIRCLELAGEKSRERYFAGKLSRHWHAGPRTNGGLALSSSPWPRGGGVQLTSNEIELGRLTMRKLGFPLDRPMVCVHVRDSAYLPNSLHHDYRDPPLEGYEALVRHLISKGYLVIRTGSVARKRMEVHDPSFLDYPFSDFKSDFMDVFIYSACEIAVGGSNSGIDYLAATFRKPIVWCDIRPLTPPTYPSERSLFIFSRMRWSDTRRELTIQEVLDCQFFHTEDFRKAGVEILPNTAEEILDAFNDLNGGLHGDWPIAHADSERRERFWDLLDGRARDAPSESHAARTREVLPRIGTSFLRGVRFE